MNAMLPAPTDKAQLPRSYEAAKGALAECEKIDECKDWADKAAALASYAKQADDETLYKTAMRIKGRAIRRYGELLKQIEPAQGARTDLGSAATLSSRKQAASDAGLSERQMKNGIRAANIPEDEFEAMIEGEDPPTITDLAEAGKKPRQKPSEPPAHLKGRTPEDFNRALHFEGKIRDYHEQLSAYDIPDITAALSQDERAAIRNLIERIDAIHDQIITRI